MRYFVVALNPDTRKDEPYSKYPKDYSEYLSILNDQQACKPGDGFHECANFLDTGEYILGFVQAWKNKAIRECVDEEFVLISISYKGQKYKGMHSDLSDRIIGIQAGCFYCGKSDGTGIERPNVPRLLKKTLAKKLSPLTYHYKCDSKLSLNIFSKNIKNAAKIVIGKEWKHPSIKEISRNRFLQVIKSLDKIFKTSIENKKEFMIWNNIKSYIEEDEINHICLKELKCEYDETSVKKEQIKLLFSSVKKQTEYVEYRGKRYTRNSVIKKLALLRADDGKCEACRHEAPFIDKNGEPFLEVHHIIPLSLNGEDELDNVAALCPNCHRKMHYGCSLSISGMKVRLYKYLPKANKKLAKIAEGK